MRQRRFLQSNIHKASTSILTSLADAISNLISLTLTHSNSTFFVTNNNYSTKSKTTTSFDDFCRAVYT